jgi:predicted transcriptional regulator
MRLRVVKRIPINEVREKILFIERKYGESFQNLHEDFLRGRLGRGQFQDYVEWNSMNHALRAAGEGEDFDYYAEEDLPFTQRELKQLTPLRVQLLDYIADQHVRSINELAINLNRDVKNVYTDIKMLEHLGFVRLRRQGRGHVPELLIQELTFLFG